MTGEAVVETLRESKLTRINHAFTEGQLEFDEYKELKNPLVQNKAELEQKLIALERDKTGRLEPVKDWIFKANQAEKWIFEENWNGNEVISEKSRLEPTFEGTNLNR